MESTDKKPEIKEDEKVFTNILEEQNEDQSLENLTAQKQQIWF